MIDSEREYNNSKSNAVLCMEHLTSENLLNKNMETSENTKKDAAILYQHQQGVGTQDTEALKSAAEQGDVTVCHRKSIGDKKLVEECQEELDNRVTFSNDEDDDKDTSGDEVQAKLPYSFGDSTVKQLFDKFSEKRGQVVEKNKDQIGSLMDQIQKMKNGMDRLYQIVQEFNCSDKFKQDIDYLMGSLPTSLVEDKETSKKLTPTKI